MQTPSSIPQPLPITANLSTQAAAMAQEARGQQAAAEPAAATSSGDAAAATASEDEQHADAGVPGRLGGLGGQVGGLSAYAAAPAGALPNLM